MDYRSKLIAAGVAAEEKDKFIVLASVYEEINDSEESGEPMRHVNLKFKYFDASEMPSDAVSYEYIKEVAGELKVPVFCFNPEEPEYVVLEEPKKVKAAKTRSFDHLVGKEVKTCVYANMRYDF